jgi:hypothetical protein
VFATPKLCGLSLGGVAVLLQVVALANDNPYGLASGVLAKDQAVIDGLVRRIRAGTVWVNTYNIYDAGKNLQSDLPPQCFPFEAANSKHHSSVLSWGSLDAGNCRWLWQHVL